MTRLASKLWILSKEQTARIAHHKWFALSRRVARAVFICALIVYLGYSLTQLGWARVWQSLPTGALFYVLLVVSYFLQPACELFVYRYLWRADRPLGLSVFMRKRVLSNTVFSYSGEAYFFLWARRHLAVPEKLLLHSIKDSNILSGMAGLLVLFALLAGIAMSGEWRLPAISQNYGWLYWIAACIPLFLCLGFIFARRKVTVLGGRQILFVFAIHLTRNLIAQVFQVTLWSLAVPSVPLAGWLNFLAARLLLSQAMFLPSGNLFLLTAGIGISGALGLPAAEVAAVLLVIAAGYQLMHFVVMALRPLGDSTIPVAQPGSLGG